MEVQIPVEVAEDAGDLPLPRYMTSGAAGMDLLASEDAVIPSGEWRKVSCGIRFAIPSGFEGQVRPRSGLALQFGVTVLNAPGTIDSDYRGWIQVILINHGKNDFPVQRGSRIAQLVIAPVVQAQLLPKEALEGTDRAQGGFGHTGR